MPQRTTTSSLYAAPCPEPFAALRGLAQAFGVLDVRLRLNRNKSDHFSDFFDLPGGVPGG